MKFIKIIFLLLLTTAPLISFSQKFRNGKSEWGFFVGGSNYFGDLAPEIVLKETQLSYALFYKFHHSRFFTSRYQFAKAKISANDINFQANSYRNLSFYSNIYELSYFSEFNFKPFGINVRDEKQTFFIFSGFNMFLFNPQRELKKGEPLNLQEFGTEGQVINKQKKYSLIQPAITLGFGYKFNLGRKYIIGTEIGFRKTFTDYLDDTKGDYASYQAMVEQQGQNAAYLSQAQTINNQRPIKAQTMRGDDHLKDWYFMFGITISRRKVNLQPCASIL